MIYLDGNSLGAPSPRVLAAIDRAVGEWRDELVLGWGRWVDVATRVGDLIGTTLRGAAPGETLAGDSTTVNLHKLVAAAVSDRDGAIVVPPTEFPTDRYVAASFGRAVVDALPPSGVCVALRSVVDYRTGEIADVAAETERVHAAGGLALWDCSHAVGVVPLRLREWAVDLAAGCSYKHIGGGPGAPAWLWVRRELHHALRPPMPGWWGQADRFAMDEPWSPMAGIAGWASGTPNVIGLAAVEAAVEDLAEIGVEQLRRRSLELTALARREAGRHRLEWASPREDERIGGHVAVRHAEAPSVVLALRARGVVPDLRPPDVIRIGLSPRTTTDDDVVAGFAAIADVLATGAWRDHAGVRPLVT